MDFCMSVAAQLMLDEIERGSSTSEPKNVVLSPMSIAIVLNMVASGSQGQTLEQFLHFIGAQGIDELSSNSQAMMSLLTASPGDNGGTAEQNPNTALVPEEMLSFGPSIPLPVPPFGCHSRPGREMPPLGASSGYKDSGSTAEENAKIVPEIGKSRRPRKSPFDHYMSPYYGMPFPPFGNRGGPVGGYGELPFPMEKKQRLVQGPAISFANALWVDHRFPLKPSFAEITDSVYKALVKNVDLVNEAEKVKEEVNSWAEKESKGLIKEVLSPTIQLKPPICLANALYFKAAWKTPFRASNTRDEDFHLLNGQTTKAPFMTMRYEPYSFGSFEDFKLLRLPYQQGQSTEKRCFSMYIFLPQARDGVKDLVAKFNSDSAALNPKNFPLKTEELSRVWMPKVKFSCNFEAQELMKAKRLTLPFDQDKADFSNMVESPVNIYIGNIIHKAFVEVNEEGTEAAAMTVALMRAGCGIGMVERPKPSFVADHPFMFMIVEDFSNLVVFTGAVLNPLLD